MDLIQIPKGDEVNIPQASVDEGGNINKLGDISVYP